MIKPGHTRFFGRFLKKIFERKGSGLSVPSVTVDCES